jgi:hypothetical protein
MPIHEVHFMQAGVSNGGAVFIPSTAIVNGVATAAPATATVATTGNAVQVPATAVPTTGSTVVTTSNLTDVNTGPAVVRTGYPVTNTPVVVGAPVVVNTPTVPVVQYNYTNVTTPVSYVPVGPDCSAVLPLLLLLWARTYGICHNL